MVNSSMWKTACYFFPFFLADFCGLLTAAFLAAAGAFFAPLAKMFSQPEANFLFEPECVTVIRVDLRNMR